ncbi:hypothetical protein [Actinacidiphila sp. ITFR-21]|uniref:hypothetical protein n=1 Tax=Actinacidiphila sp. ITFR-21 TaxID=3075199 RepID=UPI00288AFDA8|nr:hypothetical protein [Streptomyces sp. ITFR-21]WNI18060.1 hypothetical protein RLT57_22590 [Streptomyces sp. ITFR-21]
MKKNTYSHSEFGTYRFHGYWYTNRDSKGRGSFWCIKGWVSCWLDPGDTVLVEAHGIAWLLGGIKVYYSLGQSFSGGGRYT